MLRKERVPVSVFLKNGIKLHGTIASFDQYIVMLKNVETQAVYKHAISTITPSRLVSCREVQCGGFLSTRLTVGADS